MLVKMKLTQAYGQDEPEVDENKKRLLQLSMFKLNSMKTDDLLKKVALHNKSQQNY